MSISGQKESRQMGNVSLEPIAPAEKGMICWKVFTVRRDDHGYVKYEPWLRNADYSPREEEDGRLLLLWQRSWGDGFCCFVSKEDAMRKLEEYPIYTVCVLKKVRITSGVIHWDTVFGTSMVLARGLELVNDRWIRL